MIEVSVRIALVIMGTALVLNLVRLLRGPSPVDRIAALDTMYVNGLALLVLLGVWSGSPLYFEAGLIIAMLGFIGTIALCRFLLRGRIIE